MQKAELHKTLSAKKQYDVIVCGGGVSGVAAAITAAENGKSVLLIEKSNILGGLATLGLINLFVPMCNGRGKQIIFGLCEKWARLSAKYGYDAIPAEWKDGEPEQPTDVRYIQRFSPYIFALQLTEETKKSGADLLFDCTACEPVMDGRVCKGVITHSKSGLEYYSCKMLIDVTGDCDVLRAGGVPCQKGKNFFKYSGKMITLDSCKRAYDVKDIRQAFTSIRGGDVNLHGKGQPADIPMWSGLTVDEVTDYLVRNQLLMLENIKAIEDKDSREITHLPMMPQFRTTCHIIGDYTFTFDDLYKHFDDSICAINDFENRDHMFEIPYRAIRRSDYPNLLTAGRSVSSSGYGWDLTRVIPPAILTGQAAAEAACLAIDTDRAVADIDIASLQSSIEKDGIMIHFPDEYVPKEKDLAVIEKCRAGSPTEFKNELS